MDRTSFLPPESLPGRLASLDDAVAVFVADWCPYCRDFLRRMPEPTPQGPEVILVDMDDEDGPAWDDYRVRVIPTAIRFARGREVARADGRLMRGLSQDAYARLLAAAPA